MSSVAHLGRPRFKQLPLSLIPKLTPVATGLPHVSEREWKETFTLMSLEAKMMNEVLWKPRAQSRPS